MADSALAAVQALDDQRLKLVDEFVRRAWNMWRSLTPSDWWNDAVAEGAAAYVTQQHIAFVKAMRQQGISYADTMLRLAGVNGLGDIPQYEVVRANTDPWQVAMRVADEYRTQAVKNPEIRPATWDEILKDADQSAADHVKAWLMSAKIQLENNAVTDGYVTQNRAIQSRYRSSGVERYRRVIHPELSKTGSCGLCVVAATNTFTRADLMPMHHNCFPAWVPVMSPTGVRAADTREYRGIIVDVQAKSGGRFSVTPNHPILTTNGWVKAGLLKVGDSLLRYRSDAPRVFSDTPDDKNCKAPIGEVFHTLSKAAGTVSTSVPVSSEDFHGDGIFDTYVDVVFSDSLLGCDGVPLALNLPSKSKLLLGGGSKVLLPRNSSLAENRHRHMLSSKSIMGFSGKLFSPLWGGVFHSNFGGAASSPPLNAGISEPSCGGGSADVVSDGEFLQALTGLVTEDEIVDVRTRNWSGQVYNLQTGGNWFVASNYIVHNCKCTVAPITASNDPGLKLNSDDLMTIYKAAGKTAGRDYSTDATDLTKLRVKVVNNSELGPVLLRKDAPVNSNAPEWRLPDMKMTRAQMERMFARATEFNSRYKELLDGDKDSVRFRFDGRSYEFKKTVHTKQAWQYVRSLLAYSRGFLGLAA